MKKASSLRSRYLPFIALGMAMALVAICINPANAKESSKKKVEIQRTRLLFFPFDVDPSITNDITSVTNMLNDVAISRLEVTNEYSVMRYSWSFPTIKRMVADNLITADDAKPPFSDDNIKLVKLTKGLDFTIAMVGSVDEYNYDPDKHTLEITVSARLVNVTKNVVIKLAARTISSPSEMNMTEKQIAEQTARKAGDLLMDDLLSVPKTEKSNSSAPKK
jgi:hypothetical protein